jgi:molybdopterin/thiamine biosynthesis adenylyltransferase
VKKYLSHVNLNAIGSRGQEKIKLSKIAIIGLGGLGSPIIQYLVSSGIGRLTLIDDDIVEESNLNRQLIYNYSDIDNAKVDVAGNYAKSINANIIVEKLYQRLTDINIDKILDQSELIIDASDNFKTRFLLNKYCHSNKKSLISGSAIKMQGYLSVYKSGVDSAKPCFACFHDFNMMPSERSCSNQGVLAPFVGVIGTMMAVEAIKEIVCPENSIAGNLIYYNCLNNRYKTIQIPKRKNCKICNI